MLEIMIKPSFTNLLIKNKGKDILKASEVASTF
jgi:hypothetical protein